MGGGFSYKVISEINKEEKEQTPAPTEPKSSSPTNANWKEMKNVWREAKRQWKDHQKAEGFNVLNEADESKKQEFWKNWVSNFCSNNGFSKKEIQNFLNHKAGFKHGKHDKHDRADRPHKQGKSEYMMKRAEIVSNPDTVLECARGGVVNHDIEVKNNTHWDWKEDFYLGLDKAMPQDKIPIKAVNVPVKQKVGAMESYKITVPVAVLEDAAACELFEFNLHFYKANGHEFGHPIPMKIKVSEK
jgi:hypothetical protein